jgi:hypothetical protein
LDAHAATGWRVWRNRIHGFWCDTGLSEHGIHLWRASADTVVEENVVVDCARGIGFGLGPGADGHTGGVIRNNFVAASDSDLFDSEYGFDSGIVLWGAEGAAVFHNTVASTEAPFSSIEYRFNTDPVTISNNLTTAGIRDRGGAVTLGENMTWAPPDLFANVTTGDLHLVDPESSPVGAAPQLSAGICESDLEGQQRDESLISVRTSSDRVCFSMDSRMEPSCGGRGWPARERARHTARTRRIWAVSLPDPG